MNLANIDMKQAFAEFNANAPVKTAQINGAEFKYRYYKNPNPRMNATIVMLAGGSGMADGFFAFAQAFMARYSFISFNYPMAFHDNKSTADAIAALLRHLKAENVYLWGQSYGGLMAQMIAKRHPDVVRGLLLTSTASLSNDIGFDGMECFARMLNREKEQKRLRMYRRFPMRLLPAIMKLAFKKHLKGNPGAQRAIGDLMDQLEISKEYLCHMTSLLAGLRRHFGTHRPEDFVFLKGRVLIIEPEDDATFTNDIKDALVRMMPEPTVVRDFAGGHLAMMLNTDGFMQIMDSFMERQGL